MSILIGFNLFLFVNGLKVFNKKFIYIYIYMRDVNFKRGGN